MRTAYELADAILANPEMGRDEMACRIKRFGHEEKLDVYHRVFLNIKYGPRKPRMFKKHIKRFLMREIATKVETHREFCHKDWRKQIYGLFDWKRK